MSPTGGPAGLVTLIIGDTSRRSGARRGPAGPRSSGPGAGDRSAWQWSCHWSPEGPGPASAGPQGEADLTLTLSPGDAELVRRGELAPSVAFMQGRLKTLGDNALLLEVLAWSDTPAFAEALSSWQKGKG